MTKTKFNSEKLEIYTTETKEYIDIENKYSYNLND
jgi:hypothetical protein